MKILKPITTEQVLKIIPRCYSSAVDLVLKNEDNNSETTFPNLPTSTVLGYLNIPSTFSEVPPAEISENAYIKISFQADANHTIENIDFTCANNFDFDEFRVNKYTLKYDINGGVKVTLLDGVDISGTNPFSPFDIQALSLSIDLIIGDTFSLYWFPFDADQEPNFGAVGFFIKDSTVKIYNGTQTLIDWNILGDASLFVLGSNISNAVYSVGSEVNLVNYANSGIEWEGFPTTPIAVGLLEDETYYSYKVLDYTTKDIIYLGKIFVTDQTISAYSINNGQYISRGKDNTYILR